MEFKTAIIDLYNGEYNEGIRCIKDIISEAGLKYAQFDARAKNEIPDLNYDLYISSGGPGNPWDGEGSDWEKKYFDLLDKVIDNNLINERKKYFFFICHSFQIMARYFKFADVTERYKKSFGVIPFIKTEDGHKDLLLNPLPKIFYAADFRQFQVINPNSEIIKNLGASILSKELKDGDHQEALMAVRISNEIAGTQFHPEADHSSMMYHFKQKERKDYIVENFGEEKYYEMIRILEDPNAIPLTRKTVLPSFINTAKINLKEYVN